jgi:uncharacterized protein (UPF0335 family)
MENVTISKEYLNSLLNQIKKLQKEKEKLIDEVSFLEALKAVGVDNWSGYEDAQNLMDEWQQN